MLLFIGFSFSTSTRSSRGIRRFAMVYVGTLLYRSHCSLPENVNRSWSRSFHAKAKGERHLTGFRTTGHVRR